MNSICNFFTDSSTRRCAWLETDTAPGGKNDGIAWSVFSLVMNGPAALIQICTVWRTCQHATDKCLIALRVFSRKKSGFVNPSLVLPILSA